MNKTLSLFTFLLVIFLSGCSQQKQPIENMVSMDGVWIHLTQFDRIAKENGNNRAVGTTGGIASRDYIKSFLTDLGLVPVEQPFVNRSQAEGCNLLVDIKGKSAEEVVMIGSHYDSVLFGPGINDNASGVAVVLEIIRVIQQHKIVPDKTVRFAFWDSEETGVEGSPFYYNSLSEKEKGAIIAYLNVDMIASKGGEINISDTDGSTIAALMEEYRNQGLDEETIEMIGQMYGSVQFAEGSFQLETLTKEIFGKLGVSVKEDIQFAQNSDTNPFLEHIPTLGITVIKIIEEPTDDGGVSILFAPHYHQAGDDINNIDEGILDTCLKGVAAMIQKMGVRVDQDVIPASV